MEDASAPIPKPIDITFSYVYIEVISELRARVHLNQENGKVEVRAAGSPSNAVLGVLDNDEAAKTYHAMKQASGRLNLICYIPPMKKPIAPIVVYCKLSVDSDVVITSMRAANRQYWSDSRLRSYPEADFGGLIAAELEPYQQDAVRGMKKM